MDLLKRTIKGQGALHAAVASGDLAKVQRAVQKAPDVDVKDNAGSTPLHLAAGSGFEPLTRELLARHATATIADENGRTPVHIAAAAGHADVIASLLGPRNIRDAPLTKSTLVNQRDAAGCTPVMLAVRGRHLDLANVLVSRYGADISTPDVDGRTPFLAAAAANDVAAMAALASAGARVDGPRLEAHGWTPLHMAAAHDAAAAVEWLLRAGASVTTVDDQAKTPLDVARDKGHSAIVRRLREASGLSMAADAPAAASPAGVPAAHGPELSAASGPQASGQSAFLESAQRIAQMPATLYPVPPA